MSFSYVNNKFDHFQKNLAMPHCKLLLLNQSSVSGLCLNVRYQGKWPWLSMHHQIKFKLYSRVLKWIYLDVISITPNPHAPWEWVSWLCLNIRSLKWLCSNIKRHFKNQSLMRGLCLNVNHHLKKIHHWW